MKAIRILCVVLAVLLSMGACTPKEEKAGEAAKAEKTQEAAAPEAVQKAPFPEVLFKTSMGDFIVELRPDLTPVTVENFLRYVDEGFYNGKIFLIA